MNGTSRSGAASRGRPSTRSLMMLRWISLLPPAMLYCVVALMVFDESVPLAVPLPKMLKLLPVCGLEGLF